jgi:hypothetical protein
MRLKSKMHRTEWPGLHSSASAASPRPSYGRANGAVTYPPGPTSHTPARRALYVALRLSYRACSVQRQQEPRMRRTTFPQQMDLLDLERGTTVSLPDEAVLALVEQLRQLLIELTDRQPLAQDPMQETKQT